MLPVLTAYMVLNDSTLNITTHHELPMEIVIEAPRSLQKGEIVTAVLQLRLNGNILISDTAKISGTVSVETISDKYTSVDVGEVLSIFALTRTATTDESPVSQVRTTAKGATVNHDANLRAGPGTQYQILGRASLGDDVDVVGVTSAGDWYLLADDAWIAAFLVDNAPSAVPTVVTTPTAPPSPDMTPPFPGARQLTLGDGSVIWHRYQGGMPDPAENEWLRSEVVGFLLGPDGENDPQTYLTWLFGFELKKGELSAVKITDVTDSPFLLVVDDRQPVLEDGHWKGSATAIPATESGVPWLYTSGTTTRIFYYQVTLATGETVTFYQPTSYSESNKSGLRKIVR
jgi:hypothetical protein